MPIIDRNSVQLLESLNSQIFYYSVEPIQRFYLGDNNQTFVKFSMRTAELSLLSKRFAES